MSGISPGSRATTSLFMVVTLVTLAALVWRGSRDVPPADNCADRLLSIDVSAVRVSNTGAEGSAGTDAITLTFTLEADGTTSAAIVVSAPHPQNGEALDALADAQFSPGSRLNCQLYFPPAS